MSRRSWIRTVAPEEAEGLLARIYRASVERAGRVYNVLLAQSVHPHALRSATNLYLTVMRGESPLSRVQREMIATAVSSANDCFY